MSCPLVGSAIPLFSRQSVTLYSELYTCCRREEPRSYACSQPVTTSTTTVKQNPINLSEHVNKAPFSDTSPVNSHFPLTMITELSYNRDTMKQWTAEDIKVLRTTFGITQKALADLLGVTRVYIGLIEREEKKPSKTLKLLLNCVERDLRENENGERG
jgi:DNA-binding XRE family transcriptional regulator